jgi:hypothetical protein
MVVPVDHETVLASLLPLTHFAYSNSVTKRTRGQEIQVKTLKIDILNPAHSGLCSHRKKNELR